MMAKKLVYGGTDVRVQVGDKVKSSFGDERDVEMVVTGWQEPPHESSTGRVYVDIPGTRVNCSYYPGVFNLEWQEADYE